MVGKAEKQSHLNTRIKLEAVGFNYNSRSNEHRCRSAGGRRLDKKSSSFLELYANKILIAKKKELAQFREAGSRVRIY